MIGALRAALAFAFVIAGASKLADRQAFTETLRALLAKPKVTPGTRLLAIVLPALELVVGTLSLTTRWSSWTDLVVLVLATLFVGVAVYGSHRFPGMRCRCFGSFGKSQFDRQSVLRNLAIAVSAGVVVAAPAHPRTASTLEYIAAAFTGLLVAAVAAQATLVPAPSNTRVRRP